MRWLFDSGIKSFFALLAHQLELFFQADDEAFHPQYLLRMFDDHFIELFAQALVMSQLELELGDSFYV